MQCSLVKAVFKLKRGGSDGKHVYSITYKENVSVWYICTYFTPFIQTHHYYKYLFQKAPRKISDDTAEEVKAV